MHLIRIFKLQKLMKYGCPLLGFVGLIFAAISYYMQMRESTENKLNFNSAQPDKTLNNRNVQPIEVISNTEGFNYNWGTFNLHKTLINFRWNCTLYSLEYMNNKSIMKFYVFFQYVDEAKSENFNKQFVQNFFHYSFFHQIN